VKVSEATAQLTGSGVVGTPAYMAPELAESGGVSPLIDVYALGVTLFQMLTGQVPYEADTPMGVMMAHMSKPIPDVRAFRPDLSADVQAVIERVMAKDPMDRYPTAGAAAAGLRAVAEGRPVRAAAPPEEAYQATPDTLPEASYAPKAFPTPPYQPTPPEQFVVAVPRPVTPPRPYVNRQYDWMAYVALALGIISLCAWWPVPVCGGGIATVGIILGALGMKSSQRTLSIVGLVLSILGLIGAIIYFIVTVIVGVANM
jgi:serine/threonine protein kinase